MNASPNYGLQLRAWNEAEIASFKWLYSAEAGGARLRPRPVRHPRTLMRRLG